MFLWSKSVISEEMKQQEFPRTVVDFGCAQRNSSMSETGAERNM
jgi:hypothetical protein